MTSLTAVIASGLGVVLVVPVLTIAGAGGAGTACLPVTPTTGTTLADQVVAASSAAPGWDARQVAIATTIITVGRAKGVPPWGWVIAVATAMQESRLRNLSGGHADSIGVFQQRPSAGWGTPTQLASPAYQAGKFYDALLAIPGWQHLPGDQAAQDVQRSAYPLAYAKWITPATQLVEHVVSEPSQAIDTPTMSPCESGCPPPSTGQGIAGPTACSGGQAVLARAATWLTAWWGGGPVPYSMSTDPASLFHGYRRDCSGYASMALGLPGPGLNASGLAARSTPIRKADLRPGDLLINPAAGGAGHVVIFEKWTSPDMGTYLAFEQSGDGGTHHRVLPFPYAGDYPMSPYRLAK